MTVSNYLYCTMEGVSFNQWSSGLLKSRALILLDESSQIWELDAVFIFHRLRGFLRLLLGGDDKQLPPYVSRDAIDPPSIMIWVRRAANKKGFVIPVTLLLTQYRMMPEVGTVVSDNFYNGKLQHSKRPDGKKHLFFHFVEGIMESIGFSRYCVEQSKRCTRILKKYQSNIPHLTIQILTYYELNVPI